MNQDQYQTIKIKRETHRKLRILAATTGESMLDLIDRLIEQETQTMQWSKSKEEQMEEFVKAAKSLLPYTSGDEHTRLRQAADGAIEECAAELSMRDFAAIQERFGGDAALSDQIMVRLRST